MTQTDELQEIAQQIGNVTVRRRDDEETILGIHLDREDGCAIILSPEECEAIANALHKISYTEQEIKPYVQAFNKELIARCVEASGLKFKENTHSGVVRWLAQECGLVDMTTSRYFHGTSFPTPHIAKKIAKILDWDWDELVASIVEAKVGVQIRNTIRKYHARML